MKRLTMLLGLVSGFVVSGCATAAPGIVTGGIYSGYTIGSSVGPSTGTKMGEACAMSILGVVALGDASIDAAKSAGGISQVASVDHHSFSILGIYGTLCTQVKGQ